MGRVQEDEGEADDERDAAEDGTEEEAEVVEGEALPEWRLVDVEVGEGRVAGFHRAWCGSMRWRERVGGGWGSCCASAVRNRLLVVLCCQFDLFASKDRQSRSCIVPRPLAYDVPALILAKQKLGASSKQAKCVRRARRSASNSLYQYRAVGTANGNSRVCDCAARMRCRVCISGSAEEVSHALRLGHSVTPCQATRRVAR